MGQNAFFQTNTNVTQKNKTNISILKYRFGLERKTHRLIPHELSMRFNVPNLFEVTTNYFQLKLRT